jgi:2-methylisocitrate lyase-like PEP mutase family enzyme
MASAAGTPEMILEQIHAYEQAGAEAVMLQWLGLDDIEGLRAFAASVLPRVEGRTQIFSFQMSILQ